MNSLWHEPVVADGDVFCSIECARHHGHEPERTCIGDEFDEVCAGCGFDPKDPVIFGPEEA